MAERPEDLNLPISIVSRIIKETVGNNVTVSKEAKVAIAKAASVFVLYATSCTNSVATRKKRKTMMAEDVFTAMEDMDFPSFIEPLKQALEGKEGIMLDMTHFPVNNVILNEGSHPIFYYLCFRSSDLDCLHKLINLIIFINDLSHL